jgi:uncharacterized protein YggE
MRILSLLAVGLLTLGAAPPPTAVDPTHTISVRGRAEVTFPADHVILHAAVVAKSNDANAAQSQAREKAAAVLAFIRQQGVADEDLATDRLSLQEREPFNDDRPGRQPQPYFEAAIGIRVMLRDLSRYDRLLSGMSERGVNRVDGIVFDSTERTAKAKQARIEAVLAAKDKATYLTQQLGLSLGPPVTVTEVVERSYFDRSVAASNTVVATGMGGAAATSSSLSPTDLMVSAEFDIVFELVQP